jgi:hypothetical protein
LAFGCGRPRRHVQVSVSRPRGAEEQQIGALRQAGSRGPRHNEWWPTGASATLRIGVVTEIAWSATPGLLSSEMMSDVRPRAADYNIGMRREKMGKDGYRRSDLALFDFMIVVAIFVAVLLMIVVAFA